MQTLLSRYGVHIPKTPSCKNKQSTNYILFKSRENVQRESHLITLLCKNADNQLYTQPHSTESI